MEISYNIKAQGDLEQKSRRRARYADYSWCGLIMACLLVSPCSSPNLHPKSIHKMEIRKSLSYRTASIRLGLPGKMSGKSTNQTFRQDVRDSSVGPLQKNFLAWKSINKGE